MNETPEKEAETPEAPEEPAVPAFEYDRTKMPKEPGVYLYYDADVDGKLLYVGKAKHLRKRTNSYFNTSKKSPKTHLLVSKIRRIETRVVASEIEALILENNLIKKHKPKFNILLRDDKTFMYLRITNEPLPRMMITRRLVRDGSFYAGPKTNSRGFRKTMQYCQKLFGVRTCKLEMTVEQPETEGGAETVSIQKNPEKRKIPCLDFHLKKCSGPCSGDISQKDYVAQIDLMKRFLRGDTKQVLEGLTEKMMGLAKDKKFESAAKVRDLMANIAESTERQRAEFTDFIDRDFIGIHRAANRAIVTRLAFRRGKLLDQNHLELKADADTPTGEVLANFLMQFYPHVDELPKEILLPDETPDGDIIIGIVADKHFDGRGATLLVPQKGEKKRVIEMATRNAELESDRRNVERMSKAETFSKALPQLAEALRLKDSPTRIECYDISHLSGTHTVASMVVFTDGRPDNGQYRRFKIKTLPDGKIDDFAAMNEVLGRRFHKSDDKKFAKSLPSLVVIDGGKGQLSAVMKALRGFDQFPEGFDPETQVIALAKREEQIFRPGNSEPLELSYDSAGLKILQRIRDEAHRFAITFNRSLRIKSQTKSLLDEVDGVGPKTKKALLQGFGSVSGIRNATDDELLTVVNKKQLDAIRRTI